jgi:hypothetical protein
MGLAENLSENMLFDLIVWIIVLIGIVITRFHFSKNKKNNLPKIIILIILSLGFVSSNFDLIFDLFGIFSKGLVYSVISINACIIIIFLIFLFLKFKELFDRKLIVLFGLSLLAIMGAFILEQSFGLDINIPETIIVLVMISSLYGLIIKALIKMESKK